MKSDSGPSWKWGLTHFSPSAVSYKQFAFVISRNPVASLRNVTDSVMNAYQPLIYIGNDFTSPPNPFWLQEILFTLPRKDKIVILPQVGKFWECGSHPD